MQLPTPRQRVFFGQAALRYQHQLAADTIGQTFLRSRGISVEWAGMFRLGVVREPLVGHERYRGRIAIPYITPAGIVNFSFRCPINGCDGCKTKVEDGGHPKYLAPVADRTLYNVRDLDTKGQAIHVTEGELDALTLSMCGLPAVAAPGVKAWKPWFTICLQDFAEVYAWGDGDKAGREFSYFLEKELRARRVAVPRGEDCNGIYLTTGAEGLRRLAGQ